MKGSKIKISNIFMIVNYIERTVALIEVLLLKLVLVINSDLSIMKLILTEIFWGKWEAPLAPPLQLGDV